jgi:hypothetical protein
MNRAFPDARAHLRRAAPQTSRPAASHSAPPNNTRNMPAKPQACAPHQRVYYPNDGQSVSPGETGGLT